MGNQPEQNNELTADVSQASDVKLRLTGAEYKAFLAQAGITDAMTAIEALGLNVANPKNEADNDDGSFEACA